MFIESITDGDIVLSYYCVHSYLSILFSFQKRKIKTMPDFAGAVALIAVFSVVRMGSWLFIAESYWQEYGKY